MKGHKKRKWKGKKKVKEKEKYRKYSSKESRTRDIHCYCGKSSLHLHDFFFKKNLLFVCINIFSIIMNNYLIYFSNRMFVK